MKTRRININKLSKEEKENLCDELYPIHCEIFSGLHRKDFYEYVIDSRAERTRVDVIRNEESDIVGYLAVHYFYMDINNQKSVVIRGEAGIKKEYRKKHQISKMIFTEGLKAKIANLFRKDVYVLGCFVNPIMYYVLARDMYCIYPNYRSYGNDQVDLIMNELAFKFQMKAHDDEHRYSKQAHWIVKESDLEHLYVQRNTKKEIEFYLKENPFYQEGYGLQTLIPFTYKNLLLSSLNVVLRKAKSSIRFTKLE